MILRRRYKISNNISGSLYKELDYIENPNKLGMVLNTKAMNNLYGFEIKFKCTQSDLDLVENNGSQITLCSMYGSNNELLQQTYTKLYLRKRNDVDYFAIQLNEGVYTYPEGHAKEGQQTTNSSVYYMLGESDDDIHTVKIVNDLTQPRYLMYLDGVQKGYKPTTKLNENPVTAGVNYSLLGSTTTSIANANARIYYFKAYDDQLNIIADIIPVKRTMDNKIGLYDIVTDTFYPSQFTAGPIKYDEKIEYLGSTGDQYIDTGYIPTGNNIKIEGKYYLHSYAEPYSAWFAAYVNENTEAYRIIRANTDNSSVYFTCGVDASNSTTASVQTETAYVYELTSSGLVLNNITTTSNTYTASDANTSSLFLFSRPDGARRSIGRHYYFKVYRNNVLVLDMIPVRKGDVGYMYDKITHQVFGNSGTGNFTLGPDL